MTEPNSSHASLIEELIRTRTELNAALDALSVTQRTVSGSFANGWMIKITGYEMDAIRKVLETFHA